MEESLRNSFFRSTLLNWGLVLVAATAWASKPSAHPRGENAARAVPASVQDVSVGAYVMHIHEVNIRENYFIADFYVWFRWRNDDLKPYKTFSLVDAREDSKTEPVVSILPEGSHYAYTRIVAKVTKFWDLKQYPLDNHNLDINIEEDVSEDHLVRYVADEKNSGADPNLISMPGWKLVNEDSFAGVGVYRSNFGDLSLPTGQESRYSRFTLRMNFAREGDLVFLKLLFGVWVGAGISFVAFFIAPSHVDPRFGVGVGAIFAGIASEYIVTQSLPDTNVVTLADKLHVLAFAFIFASIVESTSSLYLVEKGRTRDSSRLDRIARWAFPISFALLSALAVWLR